jgi:putative ATP-binding cassette transporter
MVDDIPIDRENGQAYREMISAIFTDFHLFKKLYGISGVSSNVIKRTLEEMKIADRTSFIGGSFDNLDLSTGQRKRLAMAIALLEDRPLYIFDEWAADQDPQFRHYYYEWLLPALKSRGKTVLAISHDDRYFRCADRVITMEHGAITSISGS